MDPEIFETSPIGVLKTKDAIANTISINPNSFIVPKGIQWENNVAYSDIRYANDDLTERLSEQEKKIHSLEEENAKLKRELELYKDINEYF